MVLENINQDLVAYYSLEEISGATRLDFANQNDLTDFNTVDAAVAVVGSGAHFTRTNSEHLDAGSSNNLDFGDEDFTIAFWASLDSKPAGAQTIVSKFREGTNRQYFVDFESVGDRFRFLVDSDGTSGTTIVSANNFGSPAVNTLIFVVAWHDSIANTINIQVNNGAANSAAHSAGVFQGSALFSLGSYQDSGGSAIELFNGIADEVAVWNRTLTSTEKEELYNSGAAVNLQLFLFSSDIIKSIGGFVSATKENCTGPLCFITSSLEAYWKLEESTDTRYDFANGNNLEDINTVGQTTGKIGNAADFVRANSEHLDAADSGVHDFGDEDFTLAFWVKLNEKDLPAQNIVGKFEHNLARQYLADYRGDATDRFRFIVDSDGDISMGATSVAVANNFGSPTIDVFVFIVCWHDATANTVNIQVNDGTVDSVAHSTGVAQGSAVFEIGASEQPAGTPVAFLDGAADEVGIWGRILTAAERTAMYNSGSGINIDDLFLRPVLGGFAQSTAIPGEASGFLGGYSQGDPFVGPTAFIGGYLLADAKIGPTGIIGGFAESRGFLGPDGNIGGFVFSRASDDDNIFAILGGFLNVPGTGVGPVAMGGFALSLPLFTEDPVSIGGVSSGLFQAQRSIGGYSFGQPAFTNFVATRGRTLIVATSENVAGQDLNIDAQIVFKALAAGDFNAKLDNIKTSQGDVIAAVQVEKFQLPPTVFIQSVELMPASGETGPLNTLSPSGARQVCVTASGFLNDGDEFVSAHIDFADPFTNQPGTANKPFLSVSGFTGPPPWIACHDYDMSGIYKITARAQDNRGMVGMDLSGIALTSGLTAGIHYPVVSISGTPRFGNIPPSMQVNFTLQSSGLMVPPFTNKESNDSLVQSPTDDRILWQFGNRERSLKKNPFTFYQSPGLFAPKVMYKLNHPSGFGRIMVSDSLLIGFVR